jgi:photosystem II stability/assembly factor-like uncharacterized protein
VRSHFLLYVGVVSPALWADWTAIGPFGGSAAFVQADRNHPGTVIAATGNAQVFRSKDDGDSWKAIPFPAKLRATMHAFVLDPQHGGVYLAGLSSENPEFSGILRSIDNGLTWNRLPDPRLKDVWSIAVWSKDSRVIAAGTGGGILLTSDGGESWQRVSPLDNHDLKPVVSLAIDPWDSRILYAGTPHLAWKTLDGGATWVSIHEGMLDDSDVFSLLVEARRRQRLFASTCGGIYRSLDRGAKWTRVAEAAGASYRTYQITQHPMKPNVLFAGTTLGLVRSIDGGSTWRRLSTHPTRWIAFDPEREDRIFVATDETGLFRSDDLGDSLQAINQGFCNRRISSLAASASSLYITVQDSGGSSVLRRDEAEQAWEDVPSLALSQGADKIVSVGQRFLYLIARDGLLVSADSGWSWKQVSAPPIRSKPRELLLADLEGNSLLVEAEHGLYQTNNAGRTWTTAKLPDVRSGIQTLLALGPRTFGVIAPAALSQASRGNPEIYGLVTTEDRNLLAATSRGLRWSNDLGMTWRSVPGALEGSTVRAICKHPARAGVLFASQYGRVFRSSNDGRSWTPFSSGDGGAEVITALLVTPGSPDQLLALTPSSGVYVAPLH